MIAPSLSAYSEQFETLFNQHRIACMVCELTPPYRVNYHSVALRKLIRLPDDDSAMHLLDWVHPDDRERYQLELKAYAAQPETPSFERLPFRILNQNGEIKWVRELVLIDDSDGQQQLVLSWEDITKRYLEDQQNRENKHQFNLVLDSLNVGFFEFLFGTNTVFYSPTWKKQLGYEPYEIEDKMAEWEKRVPPKYVTAAYKNLEKHLSGKTEWYEAVFPMRHKQGHQVWILARGKAERDANGHPYKIIGTHTDLSAVQKLPKQLQALADIEFHPETLYQRAFATAPIPLSLFNLNSNKVEINPKMVELCGYQSQELTGQVYTRFFHPDDRQASIEAIERHIRNATPNLETVERRAFHKDGRLLTLRITSFVTTLENDDRVLCSYIEDITEATQKDTEMDAKSSPLD